MKGIFKNEERDIFRARYSRRRLLDGNKGKRNVKIADSSVAARKYQVVFKIMEYAWIAKSCA